MRTEVCSSLSFCSRAGKRSLHRRRGAGNLGVLQPQLMKQGREAQPAQGGRGAGDLGVLQPQLLKQGREAQPAQGGRGGGAEGYEGAPR